MLDQCAPVVVTDDLEVAYPADDWIKEHGLRGYIGHPLVGQARDAIGIVLLEWSTPISS